MAKQKGLTAMTKAETIRLALEKNKALVKQVNEMRKKDPALSIDKACKSVNWTFSQYYSTLKKLGKSPGLTKAGVNTKKINYPDKRKAPTRLTVTTMPVTDRRGVSMFMLFGTPADLAGFARSYEQA